MCAHDGECGRAWWPDVFLPLVMRLRGNVTERGADAVQGSCFGSLERVKEVERATDLRVVRPTTRRRSLQQVPEAAP